MTARHSARSRLIAVDGTSGRHLAAAATRIVRALRDRGGAAGASDWDSSGIFTELAMADRDVPGASARTLTLLYAADLAFRSRAGAPQADHSVRAGHAELARVMWPFTRKPKPPRVPDDDQCGPAGHPPGIAAP